MIAREVGVGVGGSEVVGDVVVTSHNHFSKTFKLSVRENKKYTHVTPVSVQMMMQKYQYPSMESTFCFPLLSLSMQRVHETWLVLYC